MRRSFLTVLAAFALVAPAVSQTDQTEFVAGSWGGKVRSGPSLSHPQIASLRNGDVVTVLENAGGDWLGMPFFRIRLEDGTVGYQAGGIMCGIGAEVPGMFQVCTEPPARDLTPNIAPFESLSGNYQLKSDDQGETMCMSRQLPGRDNTVGMIPCTDGIDMWVVNTVPELPDYYTIKTASYGGNRMDCLDGHTLSAKIRPLSADAPCDNPSATQLWRVVPVGQDRVSLQTRSESGTYCLESYGSENNPVSTLSYMAQCETSAGQRWQMIKLD